MSKKYTGNPPRNPSNLAKKPTKTLAKKILPPPNTMIIIMKYRALPKLSAYPCPTPCC